MHPQSKIQGTYFEYRIPGNKTCIFQKCPLCCRAFFWRIRGYLCLWIKSKIYLCGWPFLLEVIMLERMHLELCYRQRTIIILWSKHTV